MNWTDKLVAMDACSDAVEWAKTQPDLETAWANCERADWMIWLSSRTQRQEKAVYVRLAVGFARSVLPLVPAGEERPRLAIEAAEAWLADPSEAHRKAAAEAAVWAAAAAEEVVAAAAEAEAWSAGAAAEAVWAGAAWAAAWAAAAEAWSAWATTAEAWVAWATADKSVGKANADLVRAAIPCPKFLR